MSLWTRVKGIKKRWYVLLVIILLIVGITGTRFYVWEHFQKQVESNQASLINRQVDLDLIYLENYPTQKITSDQAKQILPLLDRLNGTTDSKTQQELAQQIYGQLTPAQYSLIMDQGKGNFVNGNGQSSFHGKEREVGHDREGVKRGDKGINRWQSDPREQALSNVTLKMLQDRSNGK